MAKRVNWDFIEPLFRASRLTNVAITRQYAAMHEGSKEWKETLTETAIRKRARQKGWKKDLTEAARKKAREKLVRDPDGQKLRGQVRDASREATVELSDDELVEAAAESMAQVTRIHRAGLADTRALIAGLKKRVAADEMQVRLFAWRGDVTEHEYGAGMLETAQTLDRLASAEAKVVLAERKAWGMDDKDPKAEDDLLEFNIHLTAKDKIA